MLPSNIAPFWKGSGYSANTRIFQKANWTAELASTIPSAEATDAPIDDQTVASTTSRPPSSVDTYTSHTRHGSDQRPIVHATFVGQRQGTVTAPQLLLMQQRQHQRASPSVDSSPVSLMDANTSVEALADALSSALPNRPASMLSASAAASTTSLAIPGNERALGHSKPLAVPGSDDARSFRSSYSQSRSPGGRYGQWLSVSAPEGKSVDDHGFLCDLTDGEASSDAADSSYRVARDTPKAISVREAKWATIMDKFKPDSIRKSKKVRRLVKQGIPSTIRGQVWLYLADVDKYRKAGIYEELKCRAPLEIYETIERDIQRCYPNHVLFHEEQGEGQATLHSILKAYAHYNPSVGYCQGMGRLVGLMLMQLDEEDTFWLLVATISQHLEGYYSTNLGRLRVDATVFEHLLASHSPAVAKHLNENGVVPLMYVTQWFLTLYTMALPWESVLRVWDVFYFGGNKFLFRVALGLLDISKHTLLYECPTNSEILSYLLHLPISRMKPDDVLRAAFRVRLRRQEISRLARRIQASQEQADRERAARV